PPVRPEATGARHTGAAGPGHAPTTRAGGSRSGAAAGAGATATAATNATTHAASDTAAGAAAAARDSRPGAAGTGRPWSSPACPGRAARPGRNRKARLLGGDVGVDRRDPGVDRRGVVHLARALTALVAFP